MGYGRERELAKTKVIFVYPRMAKADFGSGAIHMPLGILYLASYLREHGIDCSIVDCTFMESWQEFKNLLRTKIPPDIIGVSFSSPLASQGFKAIEISRKIFSSALVVAGGAHPTVDPENVIRNKDVDVVILGEGEYSFLQLVESYGDGKNLSNIDGIYYKNGLKVVSNGKTKFIQDLDKLPLPARDLIDMSRYIKETGYVTLITSRGCYGNCFYCQPTIRKLFGRGIRAHSPEYVIREIKDIKEKYYQDNFILTFEDDAFCYDKERTIRFCKLMMENDLNTLPWWCIGRVDHLDEEIVYYLRQAGCIGISLGVEFGSQKILNKMRKGITVEQVKRAFHLCHKNSLITLAYFMVGAPSETLEDIEKTKKLIQELHPDMIAVSIVTPMMGSDLYKWAKRRDLLNIVTFSEFGYYGNTYPLKLNLLSEEDLVKAKKELRKVYLLNLYKNLIKYLKIFVSTKHRMLYIRKFLEVLV